MATKYESYITGGDTQAGVADVDWEGQTFTPSTSHTVTIVKLKLWRVLLPGTITVSIRATTSSVPSGADLCSGTTSGDTLPTSAGAAEWREIELGAGTALTATIEYAICIRAISGTKWTNYVQWRTDGTSATYTGGDRVNSTNSGVAWTTFANKDSMFEEWGEAGGAGSSLPVVYTQACTNTTAEKSIGWGILNSIGDSAVTQHGHCWNPTTNPTISGGGNYLGATELGAKPNLGQFSSIMTTLIPGTTYYVRAYATNSYGTAYGQNVTIGTGSTIGRRYFWTEKQELHYFDEYGAERIVKGVGVASDYDIMGHIINRPW